MMRIPFNELHDILTKILISYNFTESRAALSARLICESSLDGVGSHGVHRFPTYISGIERGYTKPNARPEQIGGKGVIENWEGNLGPGNLNAYFSMGRAIEIAGKNGMGCVALRNTNHWLRGGTYGWQAAEANCIGICWTNTKPNMPPWGGAAATIGNNPFVVAVPRNEGHIVLDMALSLYSYGKLESYRLEGKKLPFYGGYDSNGRLTKDPGSIENSERLLPIGYWKGSGLSFLLDIIAVMLSGGDSVYRIGKRDHEYGLSQIFFAINAAQNNSDDMSAAILEEIMQYTKSASTDRSGEEIFFPGERTLIHRRENLLKGVPVDDHYWQQILAMRK